MNISSETPLLRMGRKKTFIIPPAIQKTHKSITKGERTIPKGDQ